MLFGKVMLLMIHITKKTIKKSKLPETCMH